MSERDCYREAASQEIRQLSEAINKADAALVPTEAMLGLNQEAEEAMKVPEYGDVPRRLDTRISRVVDLARRLELVQKAVDRLKESVG